MRKRRKLLWTAVLAAVLLLAFWYGGNAPGSRGFGIGAENAASDTAASDTAAASAARTSPAAAAPSSSSSSAASSAPAASVPAETEGTAASSAPAASPSQPAAKKTKPAAAAKAKAEGGPAPAQSAASSASAQLSCTLSISCRELADHPELLSADKRELVPADGALLQPAAVAFTAGESVFDVLQRVCRQQGIVLESSFTPLYHSAYIEGIGNLCEFDAGERSGWLYTVNGESPSYGCSQYALSDGDTVVWQYTVDFGAEAAGG